jgi:predicted PurR-regulated permease PerM
MELRHFNTYFFFLFFLLAAVGVAFLFLPFFSAIIIASILAVLFQRPYRWLLRETRESHTTSALLTCFLVAFVIVVPVFVSLTFAIREASSLYASIGEGQSAEVVAARFFTSVGQLPVIGNVFQTNVFNTDTFSADLRAVSKNALVLLQAAYQGIAHFFFWIFVMFFALFYFLVDGARAINYLTRLSPLRDEHDRMLMKKFVSISRATIKGTLLVGIVQGILGGLAFWIVGVPSPLIWGMIMVFFSVIPMIGAGIIWFPAGVILLLLGNIWQGLFVLGVGLGVVSTIDNILRPKLVGRDTHMHPLLVFFATLGGLSFFGLLGFIIGPIIVALFLALAEIYTTEFHHQLKSYNQAKTGA